MYKVIHGHGHLTTSGTTYSLLPVIQKYKFEDQRIGYQNVKIVYIKTVYSHPPAVYTRFTAFCRRYGCSRNSFLGSLYLLKM